MIYQLVIKYQVNDNDIPILDLGMYRSADANIGNPNNATNSN